MDAVGDDVGYMDMDLFRNIIEQARGKVREINLFLRGESMLHPHIFEMVRLCDEAGIVSNLSTNATMLTEDYGRRLLDAGLGKMTISFDAGVPAKYEEMRKGAKFDRTLRNVLLFLNEKKRRGGEHPYVVMQVIQLFAKGENQQGPELPTDFVNRFEGLPIDEWDTFWAHGWAGTMGDDGSAYTAMPHGSEYFPCNWLWKSMAIYWDGTVPACCADFSGDQIIGNLNKQSLMEVWNGPAMQALRSAQVHGRLDEYPLCEGCDAIWQDRSGSWEAFSVARSLVTREPLPELRRPIAPPT
jgi:radical SAM protein with 4Fe4S-binding SPASM domain